MLLNAQIDTIQTISKIAQLKMPETNFDQALHYLTELHKAQKLFDQHYKIIDMRDHTKYYIEKY